MGLRHPRAGPGWPVLRGPAREKATMPLASSSKARVKLQAALRLPPEH